jgi:hypothetical protein
MMVLVYDFDPKKHSLDHAKMSRKLSTDTVNWLKEFQSDIRKQAVSLGETVQQYYIPIDLKLAIVKNPNKSDIVINSGKIGKEALIIEVPKDVDKTHPYRRKELTEVVNKKLNGTQTISSHDINCIKAIFNLESRTEFVYSQKYYSPKYSDAFADWIVMQITKNTDFIAKTRKSASTLWHS